MIRISRDSHERYAKIITWGEQRMYRWSQIILSVSVLCIGGTLAEADPVSQYPDIPRIDVHTHTGGDAKTIENYLLLRQYLIDHHKADLAMEIDLGGGRSSIPDNEEVLKLSQGRILCCISDYSPHTGLKIDPNDLQGYLDKGYIGYKIWAGPPQRKLKPGQKGYPYVDDPAHDPTFTRMEEIGMVGASIHIADPCGPWGRRTEWLPDPVEYWKQIMAWRHVLERHPKLQVVNAHAMWAICQDGQIDYLRNALATFPGLNVDLAATFQYYDLVTYENLRTFMIEYADRILYGTDNGRMTDPEKAGHYAQRYFRSFQILETDETVPGSFFEEKEIKGLALPKEVLEKIYYKNAARIYPRVKEQLQKLGYSVE